MQVYDSFRGCVGLLRGCIGLFSGSIGLFCGSGLFCGRMRLYLTRIPTSAGPDATPLISTFKFTGLFCGYVGLFCGYLGLCCGFIRLHLTRTLTPAVPDANPLISSINLPSLYFVHFENSYVFCACVLRRFNCQENRRKLKGLLSISRKKKKIENSRKLNLRNTKNSIFFFFLERKLKLRNTIFFLYRACRLSFLSFNNLPSLRVPNSTDSYVCTFAYVLALICGLIGRLACLVLNQVASW